MIAIVVGGAERVVDDWVIASNMCAAAGVEYEVFVTNDMIPRFNHYDPVIAVTLHPDKLEAWLKERMDNGYPRPREVWSIRSNPLVHRRLDDWGGSSGLFAFQVARKKGHGKIILCGVPMDPTIKHFLRSKRTWYEAKSFRNGWDTRMEYIIPYARSLSGGWTQETFGAPTTEWLIK